jgi:hypothetical protein
MSLEQDRAGVTFKLAEGRRKNLASLDGHNHLWKIGVRFTDGTDFRSLKPLLIPKIRR